MTFTLQRDFDPLDLKIVEKAFEGVSDAIKAKTNFDLESDEELEAALRRELAEVICSTGISDPTALLDVLMAELSDRYGTQVSSDRRTHHSCEEGATISEA
jgi:hypothetical protein